MREVSKDVVAILFTRYQHSTLSLGVAQVFTIDHKGIIQQWCVQHCIQHDFCIDDAKERFGVRATCGDENRCTTVSVVLRHTYQSPAPDPWKLYRPDPIVSKEYNRNKYDTQTNTVLRARCMQYIQEDTHRERERESESDASVNSSLNDK
jgi:hypothetical protein